MASSADTSEDQAGIDDALTLGDALRAARDRSGRSLAELSTATRIPVRYLTALEQNDFSILPDRVFSSGYVRAYAAALGMDEHEAVGRFKRESPDHTVPLQAPVGVAFEDVRRYSPPVVAAIVLIVLAVVGWNVFQRVSLSKAPQPSDIAALPKAWTEGDPVDMREIDLGAPLPAPPDQTTPKLYVTPGLELELTGVDPTAEGAAPAVPAAPVRRAFNPRGAVYGAAAGASLVTLQATKPAVLVIRASDNRVLFARALAEGEAWRAPIGVQAVADSNTFDRFDVYLNGEYAGALTAQVTPLSPFNARADAQARQIAAQAAAQTEAARRAAALQAAAQTPSVPAAASPAPAPR